MGDCGSNLLGLLLGAVIIEGTLKTNALIALVGPLVVLAVPLLDTGFVVAKRIKYRRPIYRGDSNHFHHRFYRMGWSQRRSVLYLYAWTLIMAGDAVALRFIPYSERSRQAHPRLGGADGRPAGARASPRASTSSRCSRSSSSAACGRGSCAAPTRTRPSTRSTSRSSTSSRRASSARFERLKCAANRTCANRALAGTFLWTESTTGECPEEVSRTVMTIDAIFSMRGLVPTSACLRHASVLLASSH